MARLRSATADSDKEVEARSSLSGALIALGALTYHLVGALGVSRASVFPSSLDELQHLSFVRWMERWPRLFPHYETMRTLAPNGSEWTPVGNYLNHPSPYYLLMAGIDRLSGGSIGALRAADTTLSLAALAVLLWGGFRVLTGWRERSVFAALLVAFPKLSVISGMINNDAAAFLAAGLALVGLLAWQTNGTWRDALLLALALAFAGWTKLTVFLMVGWAILFAEGLRLSAGGKSPRPLGLALITAGVAIGGLPTLVNLSRYGRPLFHNLAFFIPHTQRLAITFPGYARLFFLQLSQKWSAIEPAPPLAQLGLWLCLALAGAACVTGFAAIRAGDRLSAAWTTAMGFILALIPTLALHLMFEATWRCGARTNTSAWPRRATTTACGPDSPSVSPCSPSRTPRTPPVWAATLTAPGAASLCVRGPVAARRSDPGVADADLNRQARGNVQRGREFSRALDQSSPQIAILRAKKGTREPMASSKACREALSAGAGATGPSSLPIFRSETSPPPGSATADHCFMVVAFGDSPFLGSCLASLRAQSRPSKVVVTTSIPSPFVEAVSAAFDAPLVVNPRQVSIAEDWNFALGAATSRFVTLAHQDDIYFPLFAERSLDALAALPNSVFCFTGYEEITDEGAPRNSKISVVKHILDRAILGDRHQVGGARLRAFLSLGNPLACSSVTFDRERIGAFSFSNEYRSNLDWDAWLRLLEAGGVFARLPQKLIGRRHNGLTTTSRLIREGVRQHEDLQLFRRLWPSPVGEIIAQTYKAGY